MIPVEGFIVPEPATAPEHRTICVLQVLDKLGIRGASIHGVTQAVMWWITHADPQQFRFRVISLRGPEPGGEILERAGIPVTFLNKSKFDPSTAGSLVKIIHREHANVLHLHGFGATTFGRIASRLTGVPNIVHEHAILGHSAPQIVADTILARFTDRAIAVSPEVGQYMIKGRHIRPARLTIQPVGLPLEDFHASSPEVIAEKRAALGIPPEAPLIAIIGRLDQQKGQGLMIQAMAQIVRAVPEARLLIVGDGDTRQWLHQLTEEHHLLDRVIFTGFRDDVADMMVMADVIAIASRFEGGPITLFEAMSMGRPVVSTPVGWVPQIVHDGETGFVVPVGSADVMAEKLIYVLTHPEEARAMGARAVQVVQDYDLHKSVDHLAGLYRELAQRRWHIRANRTV